MRLILSALLGLEEEQLDSLARTAKSRYRRYPIEGPSKVRWIEAPDPELKEVQRRLLDRLAYRLPTTEWAHGFVPERSIVTHARNHVGRPWVVAADIRDFFPSMSADRVAQALAPLELETDLPRAVALVTRAGRLPQGAPTSPHLANVIFGSVDHDLAKLGWSYSRYADDLTFSGDGDPRRLVDELRSVIAKHGFRLASHKTRIMGRHQRQWVTGLVVNDRVSVPRNVRRTLRAALHRTRAPMGMELLGRIAFVRFVHAGFADRECDAILHLGGTSS